MASNAGMSPAARIAVALGLPERTRSFTLSAGVDRATVVSVEYYVDSVDVFKLPKLKREMWELKQPEKGNTDGD